MEGEEEIFDLFREESGEHLQALETELLALENDPNDLESVNRAFRSIHTIKGGAGFFGLNNILKLTHNAENLLDLVRKGNIACSLQVIQVMLDTNDQLQDFFNDLSNSNSLDISLLVKRLEEACTGTYPSEPTAATTTNTEHIIMEVISDNGDVLHQFDSEMLFKANQAERGGENLYLLKLDLFENFGGDSDNFVAFTKELQLMAHIADFHNCPVDGAEIDFISPMLVIASTCLDADMMLSLGNMNENNLFKIVLPSDEQTCWMLNLKKEQVSKASSDTNPSEHIPIDELDSLLATIPKSAPTTLDFHVPMDKATERNVHARGRDVEPEKSVETTINRPTQDISPPTNTSKQTFKTPEANARKAKTEVTNKAPSSLRINISLINDLMSLAGELVLARNQLLQCTEHDEDKELKNAVQGIDRVTSLLQENIMKTRLQSLDLVFGKFNRIVRDLSSQLGKKINLNISGHDVELDKSIVEAIGDPLTHIVRNSLDHGLETPDQRIAAGKPAEGILDISARQEAGKVVICIRDNGRGINATTIAEKALEKGIISEAELQRMPAKEVINLIFKPGFSTAEQVSDISGRGVGMDVVLTNLNKVGGSIDVLTRVGEGTTLNISLPPNTIHHARPTGTPSKKSICYPSSEYLTNSPYRQK